MEYRLATNEKGLEAAVADFLKALVSSGAAKRLFAAQYDEENEAVYGTLLSDASGFTRPASFAPYLNGNKGREAGLAVQKNADGKTAVFVRPCEARALVELSKLNQAARDSMLLITCDCPGTLSLEDYKKHAKDSVDSLYAPLRKGQRLEGFAARECCLRCESLAHQASDIMILIVGANDGEVVIQSCSEAGEKALEALQLEKGGAVDAGARQKFLEGQISRRNESGKEWSQEVKGIDDFITVLKHCRRCYNCRAECPICYCRECVFQTATLDISPDTLAKRSDQFSVVKMPQDTLVFHLTRLNHIATSCVACGQCTEACPQGIPVGRIFSAVGKRVQDLFEYSAGARPDQELPQTVYKEDELEPR